MGWFLAGVVILGLGAVTAWVCHRSQDRMGPEPGDDIRLQITAIRKPGNWISIVVEIRNCAPSDLHVHTIGLIDPPFGELIMLSNVDESQTDSGREITLEQMLPPQVPGLENPCAVIKLALDDPRAFFDMIGLTVVVSHRADRSDQVELERTAKVWLLP